VKTIAFFCFILVFVNGKLVFRAGFLDCLNYVFEKQGARLIDSNMANTNPTALTTEFNWVANRSRRIQKPVMHLSLSPHPDDAPKLDDVQKRKFTVQLLESIGMSNCQWVLVEHNDTVTPDGKLRPHLHVVANRIPLNDCKAVNSSFLKRRIEKSLQQLRQEYDLKLVPASWEVKRKAPSTGQVRRYRQEQETTKPKSDRNPPNCLSKYNCKTRSMKLPIPARLWQS
jgi:Relaxase/Mobilisation nuclease domain